MKRYVYVSFAFLAVAFYELSGGSDFKPRVAPAPPAPSAQTAAVPSGTKQTTPHAPVQAAALVASPAIPPASARTEPEQPVATETAEDTTADRPADTGPQNAAVPEPDPAANDPLDRVRASLALGQPLFSDTGGEGRTLTLTSLEDGVAGLGEAPAAQPAPPEAETETEAATPAPPPPDIREIRATRVNMRDGPGTIYPVLARLTLGQEVEVLGESGTGWLRLRVLPGRTKGWVAASLVSKPSR